MSTTPNGSGTIPDGVLEEARNSPVAQRWAQARLEAQAARPANSVSERPRRLWQRLRRRGGASLDPESSVLTPQRG